MTDPASDRYTLYLAGDDPASSLVTKIVADWSTSSLVNPTLWVSPEAWARAGGELETLQATLCSVAEARQVPLLETLGRAPIGMLRLVLVQVVATDQGGDPSLTSLGVEIAGKLAGYLPADTDLRIINVIVPAGQVDRLPAALVLETGVAPVTNVVVSPEERVGDAYINVGVVSTEGGNLEGHAAAAAVTVAGSWSGMPKGPFDERDMHSAGGDLLVVCRPFVATVQVDPLIDAVTEAALHQKAEWPLPDQLSGTGPISALDAPRLVDRMVEQCSDLEGGAFKYVKFVAPTMPPPSPIGFFSAFLGLFRFVWWRLRHLNTELSDRVRAATVSKAERMAQSLVYGDDSALAVRVGGKAAPEPVLTAESLMADAHHVLEVTGKMSEMYAPPMPAVWRTLRGLTFGLLDGSGLPPEFEDPSVGGRRQVITRPGLLAPDPFDPECRHVSNLVNGALERADVTLSPGDPYAAHLALLALRAELSDRAADRSEESASRYTHAIAALNAWVNAQQAGMLWRLADLVGGQLDRARQGLADALARMAMTSRHADGRLAAAWQTCRRRWLAALAAAAIAVTFIGLAQGPPRIRLALTISVIVVFYLLVVWAFVLYSRVEFQVLHARERNQFEQSVALDRAIHNAEETVRLGSLYRQLADWSEIIGGIVHRPWGVPPLVAAESAAMPRLGLVASCSFGRGRSDDSLRSSLASAVGHTMFTRGWAGEVYSTTTTEALNRLAAHAALPTAPDPDLDTPQAGNGARRHLMAELADRGYGSAALAVGRGRVAEFCRAQPPSCIVSDVQLTAPGPAQTRVGPVVAVDDFFHRILPADGARLLLPEIWAEEAQTGRLHEITRTRIWGPGAASPGRAEAHLEWQPLREVEMPGGGLSIKAVRLDTADPCRRSSLSLFDHDAPVRPVRPSRDEGGGD